MTAENEVSRRDFVKSSALAAMPLALGLPSILSAKNPGDQAQVGFIGPGGRGSSLLASIINQVSSSNVRVAAICDIDEGRLNTAIERSPGPKPDGYKDYRKLLERKDLDAVFIATPVYLHSEMAVAALEAGKNVYCEKPMGRTPQECRAVMDAVKKAGADKPTGGPKFQVGFQWRYQEVWQRSIELVQKGEIGKVLFLKAQRHTTGDLPRATPWYFKRDLSGDIIVEQAVHEMNIFCWLLNAHAEKAAGLGGIGRFVDQPAGRSVMDHYSLCLEFPQGVRISYSHCFFAPQGFAGLHQHVYGEQGGIDLVDGVVHKDGKATRLDVDRVDATEAAIKHFFKCVHEDTPVLANAEAGYRATMTAILGRTAIHSGKAVSMSDPAMS